MSGMQPAPRRGLSVRQARSLEYTIVAASIVALAMIFQPFSLGLFTLGAAAIVIVGLVFNLVPLSQPGKTVRSLVIAGIVIVVAFGVITLLALGSAELYAYYIAPPPE